MKKVERKLSKAQITTICLLIFSILLGGAYFTVSAIIKNRDTGSSSATKPTLDLLEGESSYLNQPVAYSMVEESNILAIEVKNPTGRFGVSRYPDDLGSFMFHYYVNGIEGVIPYTPPIYTAEGEFDYESLYAVETGDGYGMIYYLTYLCTAIGTPYFTERIELPLEDTEENIKKREALLREYGFSGEEYTSVSFMHGKRDKTTMKIIEGTEDYHVLLIGKKAVSGNGYYFMVDGRNYVYYTSGEYFGYALAGFNEFVKGRLVAEGLEGESTYGPYLTTDFKSWMNTVYDKAYDKENIQNPEDADKVLDGSQVIFTADVYSTIDKGASFKPSSTDFNGYEYQARSILTSFDLSQMAKRADYSAIKGALVGNYVGIHDDNIILSLIKSLPDSESKRIDFGESDIAEYTYVISKIESIITEDGETTEGTVSASDSVKVVYRYTYNGAGTEYDLHGIIALSDLSEANRAEFIGKSVGELGSGNEITLNVVYTKDNALTSEEKYVLTGIVSIFDADGAVIDVVGEDSYVNISYYYTADGVKSKEQTSLVRLSDISDDSKLAPLKTVLLGRSKGAIKTVIYDSTYYYQVVRDFTVYEISEIKYCVTSELVVSFKFANASERDPYYGESLYTNTLTNGNSIYGLNSSVCEGVVKLLGGIGSDSNSAVGYSGKTVAVGLTVENMHKYDLYAHKIYFELPRGIYDASEGTETADNDALSDFAWLSTLGFTLYISDEKVDENGNKIRYIGSDMYDLIAVVDAKDFTFLDSGFVDLWARRNLLMMSIDKLAKIKLEFNMSDIKGTYDFEVVFKEVYGGYINGEYEIKEEEFEGSSAFIEERVNVKASDDATETELKKLLDSSDSDWYSLAALYNKTMGDGKTMMYYPGSRDTLGAAYFNSVYEVLQLTRYQGILDMTDEEKATLIATAPKVMSMTVEVVQVKNKIYSYTYDFYRIDDRRVMVSLSKYCTTVLNDGSTTVEFEGSVTDFYISTFAFKKLVRNYVALLNGEAIDGTIGYDD